MFYVAFDGQMTAVPVDAGGGVFKVGKAQALFPTRLLESNRLDYDVAKDGRFLIAQPVAAVDEPRISVIVNWTNLLTR